MPLIEKREHENYTLVVWDTTEETEFFIQKVFLKHNETETYQKISNDKRRKEWLAVRFILQEILAIASEITYDQNRKPHIPEVHISISHAGTIVSVIVSKYHCAIDVEEITARVSKVAHRAFSDVERQHLSNDEQLTTYWCVKEVIFKLYGGGEVDFKRDMEILPVRNFNSGVISCRFLKKNVLLDNLILESFGNYKLVWIVDKLNVCHGI